MFRLFVFIEALEIIATEKLMLALPQYDHIN